VAAAPVEDMDAARRRTRPYRPVDEETTRIVAGARLDLTLDEAAAFIGGAS
jgi:hypothetical protein